MVFIEESRDLRRTDASVKVVSPCRKVTRTLLREGGERRPFPLQSMYRMGKLLHQVCRLLFEGLTFDVNIMSAVGCGMDLNTVGVIGGVRGESEAEIWAGFKISKKEMELF